MIPYRDTIPCRYTPWITWTLIGVNGLIFLYTSLLSERVRGELFYRYGLVPARYTWSGWEQWAHMSAHDYASFVTSMFLHGSWMHLIMNMWLLWIFGDNVEDRMGGIRFISFYLLCGLFAGILQIYFSPSSLVPTVGASGAIAGIMGAFFFLYPYARIVIWVFFLPLFVPVPAIGFVGVWVILQLYKATSGFLNAAGYADVAWWGHVGGFIAGTLSYRAFLLRERRPSGAR